MDVIVQKQTQRSGLFAGLIEVVNKKMIPPGSRVVVVVTGSGLKYPPVLKEFDVSPVSVKLDQLPRALETVLNCQ